MNSLPKTVTRQRSGCDLNPGPSAPESSTLTTRLPSHPTLRVLKENFVDIGGIFGFCSKVATQLRFGEKRFDRHVQIIPDQSQQQQEDD